MKSSNLNVIWKKEKKSLKTNSIEMHAMWLCSRTPLLYKTNQRNYAFRRSSATKATSKNTKLNMHKTIRIEFLWWQFVVCEHNVHWQLKQIDPHRKSMSIVLIKFIYFLGSEMNENSINFLDLSSLQIILSILYFNFVEFHFLCSMF